MPLPIEIRTVTSGTRAERRKHGIELRRATPRETRGDLQGLGSRNAIAILAESDPDRVPELGAGGAQSPPAGQPPLATCWRAEVKTMSRHFAAYYLPKKQQFPENVFSSFTSIERKGSF
jgi:hypothetical protein